MSDLLSKVTALAKRRGIFFQNSEIYGGLAGFFDLGPVGVEMVNNLKKHWWYEMVDKRENVVGIDGTIITHPKVWDYQKIAFLRPRKENVKQDQLSSVEKCPQPYDKLYHRS